MSYSFSWDCTLPINNIQDIISINIVPETKTFDEGNYLSLKGHICIEGECIVKHLEHAEEQQRFDEKIPLDITLPNNGNVTNVQAEVTNFDYEVKNGKMLFLKVDLILAGYELEVESQIPEIAVQEDLDYHELKELVLDIPTETVDYNEMTLFEDEGYEFAPVTADDMSGCDYIETHAPTVVGGVEELERKEKHVEAPVQAAHPKATVVEPAHAIESIIDEVNEVLKPAPVVEHVVEFVNEVTEKFNPSQIIESATEAAHTIEHVAEVIEEVKPIFFEEKEEKVKSYKTKKHHHEALNTEEEITPFPIKSETHKTESVKSGHKVNLFDMLYNLESQSIADHAVEHELNVTKSLKQHEIKVKKEVKEEVIEVIEESKKSFFSDSIASQFADGASVVKVIFVQEELTIAAMCEQYQITEQAITNLQSLECPLQIGDRVMINYGRVQ